MRWQMPSSIAIGSVIETRLLQVFTDLAVQSPSLFWIARHVGGHVLFRSDCTRRPSSGLCSLTDLEAVRGRHASISRSSV